MATLLGFHEQALGLNAHELSRNDAVVLLSTIHSAKGTEASLVFVAGCEEGIMPCRPALTSGDPDSLEEERRAMFVGMTRAEDALILSWAASRNGYPQGPSRFIAEAGLSSRRPAPRPR